MKPDRRLPGALGGERVSRLAAVLCSSVKLLSAAGILLVLVSEPLLPSGAEARAAEFLDTLGFEDDVDVVVSPNREFMVVCEENADGSAARLRILDLDPATGEYIDVLFEDEDDRILGFENAVDPLVIQLTGAVGRYLVLVAVESEDGTEAKVIELLTDEGGLVIDDLEIDLGDLGFRDDVDPTWTTYNVVGAPAIAFFALQSEISDVRGVLAIDADNADGDWGSCRLLSSDGRGACGTHFEEVDWLPGLVAGVDPIAYSPIAGYAYLWIPVTGDGASDLLRLEFDSDVEAGNQPPNCTGHLSVKDENAGGPHPTPFPGYEEDVDLIHLAAGACVGIGHSLLVPVEGPGDVADLYLIDHSGQASWIFSLDNGAPEVTIPGYEAGVDLMTLCSAADSRVVVPVENAAGTDADLYIVDLDDGSLLADMEEDNGVTVPGYEVGVDIVRWTDEFLVAGMESDEMKVLVSFDRDGIVRDARFFPPVLGYQRSVAPIVLPHAMGPILVVPYCIDDRSAADLHAHFFPPFLGGVSLESINPGLELGGFEWDVDLGYVDASLAGARHLCVPEEGPDGVGRLRFESISPSFPNPLLVFATEESDGLPSSLYLVSVSTGQVALEVSDLLGLETGLDLANGRGPVTPGELPVFPRPTGMDRDGDPTQIRAVAPAGVSAPAIATAPHARPVQLILRNPFVAPNRIHYDLLQSGDVRFRIVDALGRIVCHLDPSAEPAGRHSVVWDGRDERGRRMAPGIYFVIVEEAMGATASGKLVLLR
jgi:hypothetical protein